MSPNKAALLLPEPAIYFPITDSGYSTRAGLTKFGHDFGNAQQDKKLFQLDKHFSHYRDNKLTARETSIDDYVCTNAATNSQLNTVNQFILQRLCDESPEYFTQQDTTLHCKLTGEQLNTHDTNLFDALALQVQEDICVMQTGQSNTSLIAAHLCAANHWSAREKLGMDMLALHQHVPEFSNENKQPNQLVAGLHNKAQAYVRFAWGINQQAILNQHPRLKPDHSQSTNEKIWLRIERQVLTPLPDSDLMLFTIRTYFNDCDTLEEQQRLNLINAIDSMSGDTLDYKNINPSEIIDRLKFKSTDV